MSPADRVESQPAPSPAVAVTSANLLARNVLWSVLGQGVPLVAAAIGVPILLRSLGTDAFGVLTLSWTLIGYLTLFDLGLGRALTREVASALGRGDVSRSAEIVGTALSLLLISGLIGAIALGAATPWIVERLLQVPEPLVRQTRVTFLLLAVSLPAVLLTAGLAGVLAAHQHFRTLNLVRIPMSVLSFLLPMAALPFTRDLGVLVGSIVVVRLAGAVLHLSACKGVLPSLGLAPRWTPGLAAPLLRSGGWIALINFLVPLFASFDRVLLGAWSSIGAVAYYAPPQEVATKLWIVPGTLVGVLFPAFASSGRADPSRLRQLFTRGLGQVYYAVFPITLVLIVLGGDLLSVWLGAEFSTRAASVMRFLAMGSFFTGLAFIPSALIQAVGRPGKVGLLLIAELPLFVFGLWWGLSVSGLTGAALAWSIRALVDLIILVVLAFPLLPRGADLFRQLRVPAIGTLAALAGAFAIQALDLSLRVLFLAVLLVPFCTWALRHGLAEERRVLRALFTRSTR